MTAPSDPFPLDPAALDLLLDAVPLPPGASAEDLAARRRLALDTIASLRPRDQLEAALASHVVAAHYAAMAAFRSAAQPDLPDHLQLRHQGKAIAMSRLMDATLRALQRRQQEPALPATTRLQSAPATPTKQAPQPAAAAQPAPAARPAPPPPVPPARKPDAGAPLTPAQREQMVKDLANRTATSTAALAA